jgi:hypothetical protein
LQNVSDDERWVLNGGRLRIFKSLPRQFRQHGGRQLWLATIRRAWHVLVTKRSWDGEANASPSPKRQKEKSGREAMRLVAGFGAFGVMALAAWPLAAAEMRGVTATEIKIGQTMP